MVKIRRERISCLVCLAVIFSPELALAGKKKPKETVIFKELSVSPQYRCPGEPVVAKFQTSPPSAVRITFGGQQHIIPHNENAFVIDASMIDSLDRDLVVQVQPDAPSAPVGSFAINTVQDGEEILLSAGHQSGELYKIVNETTVWSDKILVTKLTYVNPRRYQCVGTLNPHNFNVQWSKDFHNGQFTPQNGYQSPVRDLLGRGDWLYHILNPPVEQFCQSWKTDKGYSMQVQYTLQCTR